MSYPRNAASPERVDIGAVIQISDGAVQTSGVAVKVIPQGSSEASGGGTVGYSADGIVHYLPTQAETNYTSFILIASKSGCIPASKTVVTSANNTAGKVTVQTNDDKNGYALTQSFPSNFAALGINASGHVSRVTLVDTTTTNSDMRGTNGALTSLGTNAPAGWLNTAAFADGAITAAKFASGAFNAVWTVTTRGLTEAVALDSAAILAVADQVWDEATSGHTTAGTYGGRIVRATNSNTEVQITGSNHIAANVHDVQPNGLSGSTEITNIQNASGYMLAVLAGACADPQTASETYAITVFGSTFTVDMAGQTSTGTRTAPTLTKT